MTSSRPNNNNNNNNDDEESQESPAAKYIYGHVAVAAPPPTRRISETVDDNRRDQKPCNFVNANNLFQSEISALSTFDSNQFPVKRPTAEQQEQETADQAPLNAASPNNGKNPPMSMMNAAQGRSFQYPGVSSTQPIAKATTMTPPLQKATMPTGQQQQQNDEDKQVELPDEEISSGDVVAANISPQKKKEDNDWSRLAFNLLTICMGAVLGFTIGVFGTLGCRSGSCLAVMGGFIAGLLAALLLGFILLQVLRQDKTTTIQEEDNVEKVGFLSKQPT